MKLPVFEKEKEITIMYSTLSLLAIQEARKEFEILFPGVGITSIFVSAKGWSGIIGDLECLTYLDPSSKVNDVLEGYLGSMLGIKIVSDAYDSPRMPREDCDFVLYNDCLACAVRYSLGEERYLFTVKTGTASKAVISSGIKEAVKGSGFETGDILEVVMNFYPLPGVGSWGILDEISSYKLDQGKLPRIREQDIATEFNIFKETEKELLDELVHRIVSVISEHNLSPEQVRSVMVSYRDGDSLRHSFSTDDAKTYYSGTYSIHCE